MNKYEGMSKWQLWEAEKTVKRGKDARQLHRALKKADPGNGLFFHQRYPMLPLIVSIISLILVYMKPVILSFFQ